jgi:SAM-dependent methyltransferase
MQRRDAIVTLTYNQEQYRSFRFVRQYAKTARAGLTGPERTCIEQIPPASRGSILDVGIGAGRTTGPLSQQFQHYVGIDYSAPLIDAAKTFFPNLDLRVMDGRKLDFDREFDCVLFSFNGIDSVGLDDRRRILAEIHRVLKIGGYFIYSTHNLDHSRVKPWMTSLFVKELVQPWKRIRFFPNRVKNYLRQQRDDRNGMAFVNDPGVGFSLINAYVDIPRELTNLESMGFEVRATMGNAKERASYDSNDCWVYIVAQKQ